MSKKLISGILACVMSISLTSGFVTAADIEMSSDPAVILRGDMSMHNTASIYGDVIAGTAVIDAGASFDNSDLILDGNLTTSGTAYIMSPENLTISGEVKTDQSVDNEYTLADVSNIPVSNPSVFDGRSYTEYSWLTIANWVPAYANGMTINRDTHFKDGLSLFEPLTIDTTNGDVYVKIDALTLNFDSGAANNGCINVVGDNKAYVYVKGSYGTSRVVINTEADCSTGVPVVTKWGDSSKVDLYIDAGKTSWGFTVDGLSMISANVFVYNTAPGANTTISGQIHGNLILEDAEKAVISSDGNTSLTADVYAMNTHSLTINNDVTGDVVTSASMVTLTGGDCEVIGRVFAPEAAVVIHSTSHKGIIGQLVASKLEIYGDGRIKRGEAVSTPTPKPTVEPTVIPTAEPTIEPTAEPTAAPSEKPEDPYKNDLIPNNPVTKNPVVNKIKNDSAYIFGRSDVLMEPDDGMQRGEASAVLYRLLKQNKLLGSFSTEELEPSFSDIKDRWDYTAIEYMTSIKVYNSEPNPEKRKISPTTYITRGEAAKLFAFALGLKANDEKAEFADISTDDKYYEYINSLYQLGYMEGDSNDGVPVMRPNDSVKRVEFCAIYNRIIGRDDSYELVYAEDCVARDADFNQIASEAGDEVICPFIDLIDLKDDPNEGWKYETMMRATNAFTDKKVDLAKRGNRNELDDYQG